MNKLNTLSNTDFLTIRKQFLTDEQATWAMTYFLNNTEWTQDYYNFGKGKVKAPRLTALYGDTNYTYSGMTKVTNRLNEPLIRLIRLVNAECGVEFNSVLMNLYHTGKSSIGMHTDNERELGPNPTVASISLGASRIFKMQSIRTNELFQRNLDHGDLAIMPAGTQSSYKHGIDKCVNAQPRISLTFRKIV